MPSFVSGACGFIAIQKQVSKAKPNFEATGLLGSVASFSKRINKTGIFGKRKKSGKLQSTGTSAAFSFVKSQGASLVKHVYCSPPSSPVRARGFGPRSPKFFKTTVKMMV